MVRHSLFTALVTSAGALATAAALAACGGPDNDQQGDADGVPTPTAGVTSPPSPTTTTAGEQAGGAAEMAAAARTAAAAVPNGRVFDIEHETRSGNQRVWEVKVASDGREYEVDVSEDGAEVLRKHESADPDDDIQKLDAAQIDAARAAELGGQQDSGRLTELEIDQLHDGTVVWQLEFTAQDDERRETYLDAKTGDVVRTE
ncbi:Peptidase propeptide and YPEB domain-containing protein [Amycolatopsis arida]|uniref:Peptidase propeptide and YPEB domain-containing protein n=1 Tax=Amycolatopsis arida TaxID=587909 RepID=A0A1I5NZ22_9PSEU|nr:PepSY domain-containing protein [Amycolatopsis arida]TDX98293.1 peptidase YpeB-like protein [Amycolatopsis arida]SFP27023.1 Peptidase propeptide and YPEB domain-containing protein [Amycolatopsis arida]